MNEKNISLLPHSPLPTVWNKRWFFGLGIAICKMIFFSGNCAIAQGAQALLIAQITPDRTLPNNSIVTPNGSTFNITGGTQAGGNLFHSFHEFSVPTNNEAFFHNGVDIKNIISRVTGESISHIDGLIHTLGTANLFLINPNGIVFGPNASLNVGGSFIGSTAKSINFADGTFFSATPADTQALLTVSVPLGLQFGSNPGEIKVQGPGYEFPYDIIQQAPRPQLETSVPGLAVKSGQTLALVGGKVSVDGGLLKAPTGRIEIGSVGSLQSVNLVPVQQGWMLGYPEASSFGDIQISGKSFVSTTGVGGGSIAIAGKNINFSGQSILVGDTLGDRDGGTTRISGEKIVVDDSFISSITMGSGKGGQIELDANNITLNNTGTGFGGVVVQTQGKGDGGAINVLGKNSLRIEKGQLASSTQPNSTGNAGDVNVKVTGLIDINGAGITTENLGAGGNAGNINITANSLVLKNLGVSANTTNTGKGGEININVADSLMVDSAGISTKTFGTGDGGKINITANSFQVTSATISSSAAENSTGKAGDINVKVKVAGPLTIDKAGINSDTAGTGDAGKIDIDAGSIELRAGELNTNTSGKGNAGIINITANSFLLNAGSGINSSAGANSTGKAGDITVKVAGPLTIDQAPINSDTAGTGDGGKINITANSFQVKSANISSSALENSTGKAEDITVKVADKLTLDQATISTNTFGTGAGGKIDIDAGSIELGGGGLNTNTSGKGNAGIINITANSFLLNGGKGINSSARVNSTGKAGDITVKVADKLTIKAPINTDTAGTGDGGKINISANSFEIQSASISSNTTGIGKAGEINIDAGSIEVGKGGGLNTNTSGKSDAGTINLKANSFRLENGSIGSNAKENSTGNAGDIKLNVAGPLTIDQAGITTDTFGTGNAGKIDITAKSLQVASAGINSTTENNSIGNAGNITVNVPGQLTIDNSTISTKADGIGNAGQITITAASLKLDNAINAPSINATSTSGKGGDIDLEIGNILLLRHQGSISTTAGKAGAGGDGGNITINAPNGFIVAIPSENSDITANANQGSGGQIRINAIGIYGLENRTKLPPNPKISEINASSKFGSDGNVRINTPDVDPSRGLVALPKIIVNTTGIIPSSCATFADEGGSQFIVTGRGGLPPNPYDLLTGDAVWSDNRVPKIISQQQRVEKPKTKPPSQGKVVEINPATGWVFNGNGEVTLISQKGSANGFQPTPTTCQTSQ